MYAGSVETNVQRDAIATAVTVQFVQYSGTDRDQRLYYDSILLHAAASLQRRYITVAEMIVF